METNESAQTIRAFVAIPLPAEVTAVLGRVSAQLAKQLPPKSVRWVQPEQMHLTLFFLGDTSMAKLPALQTALAEACQNHKPFTLSLSELGCFPNKQRPKVLWVGLGGSVTPLLALQKKVQKAAVGQGWVAEERPFQAHLTLGRVNNPNDLFGKSWGAKVPAESFAVTAVHLMQSELRPSGPIYTQVMSYEL